MSEGIGKAIGGIGVGLLAIGGLVAKNADNLFRAGAKSTRYADDAFRHTDDVFRHTDDVFRHGDDLGRVGDDLGSARFAGGAADAGDEGGLLGTAADVGVEGVGVASDVIGSDDEN